jgi:TIR domain
VEIVISYAREDRAIVEELAGTLRAWGHDVWTDAGAHSGARWWDEIVARIQGCDVLLAVTSPASLASHACTLERRYALALGKVLLPVLVAPVNTQGLPTEFASIHFFDFTQRDVAAAGRLYQAVQQLPPPGPLPDPLPPPPPPPLSYLNAVVDQLDALVPDLDLQHRIVTALTGGLRSSDPEERATAIQLVRRFLEHPRTCATRRSGRARRWRAPSATGPATRPSRRRRPSRSRGPGPRPSSRGSAGSPSCWSGWASGASSGRIGRRSWRGRSSRGRSTTTCWTGASTRRASPATT